MNYKYSSITFGLFLSATLCFGSDDLPFRWTSIDVTSGEYSGDAHLLELPDSSVWMIDSGYARFARRSIVPLLKSRGINTVNGIVITHAHLDHYEGVAEIINAGIEIDVLYFTKPNRLVCESEIWNGGCQTKHVYEFLRRVGAANIPIVPVPVEKPIFQSEQLELAVIHQSRINDIGLSGFTINDSSAVLKLTYGDVSILFPGDIGRGVGEWLRNNAKEIKSDILVIPHHGLDQTVSEKFLETISPNFAIATASQQQWLSKRGQRIRTWFENQHIPVYVSGKHGDITILLSASISAETRISFSRISN